MNILKCPAQYALLLIDAADGAGFVAFDMLQDARKLYPMPDTYYNAVLKNIEDYVLNWQPE